MTSYPGLPEKHRELVTAFREALIEKLEAEHGDLEFGGDFESIDNVHQTEANRLAAQEDSPRRAQNWRNTYRGAAESQKLRLAFQLAQDLLSEEDIAACAPAEIEKDGTCFSRYEMEKNGLTEMADYLVPKKIREIGLF